MRMNVCALVCACVSVCCVMNALGFSHVHVCTHLYGLQAYTFVCYSAYVFAREFAFVVHCLLLAAEFCECTRPIRHQPSLGGLYSQVEQ